MASSPSPLFRCAPLPFWACGGGPIHRLRGLLDIAKFLLHQSPQGFTATILVVTFLSGVNLFFLGIVGEYVGRIYEETKARPHYIIRKFVRQQVAAASKRPLAAESPKSGAAGRRRPAPIDPDGGLIRPFQGWSLRGNFHFGIGLTRSRGPKVR